MPVLFEAPSQAAAKKSSKKSWKKQEISQSYSTPLTAYLLHPKDIRFETQEEDEEVILFMRQHIIVLLPKLILGIVILLAPFVIFPFLYPVFRNPNRNTCRIHHCRNSVLVWLRHSDFSFTVFLQWYFNIFIVTDKRIIDIDFLYLLYKKFAEAQLFRIQDVSFRTGGITATMFNFGDVLIQTAGELPNFVLESSASC